MPTYDYVCDACKHEFEEFQSMKDEPLKKCPACRKNKLRRLIGTGAAILFKGTGFYQTDYRSDSYKSAAKADEKGASGDAKGAGDGKSAGDTKKAGDATPKSDTGGSSGSESKPAAKPPPKKAKS